MEAVDAYIMALDSGEGYSLVCLDIMMPVLDGIRHSSPYVSLRRKKIP